MYVRWLTRGLDRTWTEAMGHPARDVFTPEYSNLTTAD